ncbi:unnamed protein product [Lymnaea stagnalis]|uniref:Uncharacterized protein n=1 Tax=Lymnaea stagnalis TaxID=6523 RepID=A0AAV2IGC0_LYMST
MTHRLRFGKQRLWIFCLLKRSGNMEMCTFLTYVLILNLVANSTAGQITFNSLERCFDNGEMLFCDVYGDARYFFFIKCPTNTYWTNQLNIVANDSGHLICLKCPPGTINEKPYHHDTVCEQDVSDLGKATLLTINIEEQCFTQYDFLRCETDTGWTDFITCTRNQKWTGYVIARKSDLECVGCPPNSFTPYDFHYNKTCIIREEKSNTSLDPPNSASTIRTKFINCLAYMFSIFLIKKSTFC